MEASSQIIQSLGICDGFALHLSPLPEVWGQGKRKGENENSHSSNQVLITLITHSILGLGSVFTSPLPHMTKVSLFLSFLGKLQQC